MNRKPYSVKMRLVLDFDVQCPEVEKRIIDAVMDGNIDFETLQWLFEYVDNIGTEYRIRK